MLPVVPRPIMSGKAPTQEPDLDTRSLSTSAVMAAKERARVRMGQLNGMGRLILFSPDMHPKDTSHWTIVPVEWLEMLPVGVEHYCKMDSKSRTERRMIAYKPSLGRVAWPSYIFGRVERGEWDNCCLQVACNLLGNMNLDVDTFLVSTDLTLTLKYFGKYANDEKHDRTPLQAYLKCVKRFHDAIFLNYDYPKVCNPLHVYYK